MPKMELRVIFSNPQWRKDLRINFAEGIETSWSRTACTWSILCRARGNWL